MNAGPLAVWAALQLVAIGLAAARIPLAAQYPVIGEFHASQLLLAVQLPLSAMLMPALLSNWNATLAAAILGGALQGVASLLTDVRPNHALPLMLYLIAWIAAMGCLRWALEGSKERLATGAGVAAGLIAGAPLLVYLAADLSSRAIDEKFGGPVLILLRNWPSVPLSAWVWFMALIGVTVAIRLIFQGFLHRARAGAE